jgi:hypothetical protein
MSFLLDAPQAEGGALLDVFRPTHKSSPLGWVVHGSRYSGAADQRQPAYVAPVRMLLDAGSNLHHPGQSDSDAYLRRLLEDASPEVAVVLGGGK